MKIIIPVTPKLAAELAATEQYLSRLDNSYGEDKPKLDGKNVNDNSHFIGAAAVLEKLVGAMMAGMGAAPLTGPKFIGARVAFTSDDQLNAELFRAVDYLREDVHHLLQNRKELAAYSSNHTRTVISELKRLYGMILGSIKAVAKGDLVALQNSSVNRLLDAAAALAKAVEASKVQPDDAQPGTGL